MTWLPSAERVPNDHDSGGSYNGDPWCFVIHTTEGVPSTRDGCRNMAATSAYPPHLWFHPVERWLFQTVPLDRSAFALEHPGGTYETNKSGALQVEVFAYAADTGRWGAELDNIGTDVLGPIIAAGYRIDLERVAPSTGEDGYGTGGTVRMSTDQWRDWTGLCGHANVPANQHWDPGAIDYRRIAQAVQQPPLPEPEPVEEDDEMAITICAVNGQGQQWASDLVTFKRKITSPAQCNEIAFNTLAAGGKLYWKGPDEPVPVSAETLDGLPEIG